MDALTLSIALAPGHNIRTGGIPMHRVRKQKGPGSLRSPFDCNPSVRRQNFFLALSPNSRGRPQLDSTVLKLL